MPGVAPELLRREEVSLRQSTPHTLSPSLRSSRQACTTPHMLALHVRRSLFDNRSPVGAGSACCPAVVLHEAALRRYVGLLLVTKLLPAGDGKTLTAVHDAVGSTFLQRLLLPLSSAAVRCMGDKARFCSHLQARPTIALSQYQNAGTAALADLSA